MVSNHGYGQIAVLPVQSWNIFGHGEVCSGWEQWYRVVLDWLECLNFAGVSHLDSILFYGLSHHLPHFNSLGHLFYGFDHVWWLRLLANYSFVSFSTPYLIGLKANLDEYSIKNKWERSRWFIMQVVLLPFFNILEGAGVMAAVLRPVSGFHVVKK